MVLAGDPLDMVTALGGCGEVKVTLGIKCLWGGFSIWTQER